MGCAPIVMISSYTPRQCGIATFTEEAREFVSKQFPGRAVCVICHTDGEGNDVFPIIDIQCRTWWKPVVEKINELQPYAVHLEHEYGLYEYCDGRGRGDCNAGFLDLLDAISDWPTVIELHTVHGRLRDCEAEFLYDVAERADVMLFKCNYQKWRLEWNFVSRGWKVPQNIMIVPHGARADRYWPPESIPSLREELGLDKIGLSEHLVGLVGWIQSNKRWDILIGIWEQITDEIKRRTGENWDLLAAGTWRDPNHLPEYHKYKDQIELLEKQGKAHYFEFEPRGEIYYKVMAVCDFIVLPSTDETQSGTLARVIALNKPFVTTAPMEGLTAQAIESEGGLLFTNADTLYRNVVRLGCDRHLRNRLAQNLRRYLKDVVSWDVVARQYAHAYELAREAKNVAEKVKIPLEF